MSMFECEVDAQEVLALIKAKRKRAENMDPIMAVVAEQLHAAVMDEFESQGHGKWPPLALRTHAGRRHARSHAIGPVQHKILEDTGALAGSQTPRHGADWAEVSTDKFYAVFHVSDAPRTKIPLRNFYDLPPDVYTRATEYILTELVK